MAVSKVLFYKGSREEWQIWIRPEKRENPVHDSSWTEQQQENENMPQMQDLQGQPGQCGRQGQLGALLSWTPRPLTYLFSSPF